MEKTHRRNRSQISGTFEAERGGHFFEAFLLVGLPPRCLKSGSPATLSGSNSDQTDQLQPAAPTAPINSLNINLSMVTQEIEQQRNSITSPTSFVSPPMSPKLGSQDHIQLARSQPALIVTSSSPPKLASASKRELSSSSSNIKHDSGFGDSKACAPQILHQYPTRTPLPLNKIPDFCFPQGVQTRDIPITRSQSSLNSLIFGQMDRLEDTENSFIFLIHSGETIYYGMCVLKEEILDTMPSFIRSKSPFSSGNSAFKNMRNLEAMKKKTVTVGPRCYCLISRYPFFNLHFSVLYSILGKERLYTLVSYTSDGTESSKLRSESRKIVRAYYKQVVPKIGEEISFFLPGETTAFKADMTSVADSVTACGEWGIGPLCKTLSLPQLIALYQAVLLENKILVISKNLGVLSSIVLSIIPLIRPLVFQGPLIPVLPQIMEECIQAPVPTILGMRSLDGHLKDIQTSSVVLDLDRGLFSLPYSLPMSFVTQCAGTSLVSDSLSNGIGTSISIASNFVSRNGSSNSLSNILRGENGQHCVLPRAKKLAATLTPDYAILHPSPQNPSLSISLIQNNKLDCCPYKTTPNELVAIRKIMTTFQNYTSWILTKVVNNMYKVQMLDLGSIGETSTRASGGVSSEAVMSFPLDYFADPARVEKLSKKLAKDSEMEGGEFVSLCIQTQQFMCYSESLLTALNEKRKQKDGIVQQMSQEIENQQNIIETCDAVIRDHENKKRQAKERLASLKEGMMKLMSETKPQEQKIKDMIKEMD
eukprot:TRINITY_DN3513_c0_g1_i1.p1 TRINITY_DN3513_c0_g1~~TRINITY_DN3513_c0_g1_i1.p1  ORF type:complete len:771 (+),score=140.42 TRINITY_DN3513_c0_g1_i1:27-2315(+)